MNSYLERATDILAEMKHLKASQCRNCGMVFNNVLRTHKARGWPLRPKCAYDPTGWTKEQETDKQ